MNTEKTLIKDYTSGPIAKQLILFALPLMFSNFLQTAYNLVDMAIVGQMVGTGGLSAVSIGTDIQHFYMLIAMGLGAAGQILISQYVGIKNKEGISRTVGVLFSLMLILGVVTTGIGLFATDWWMNILNVPAESLDGCRSYTLCCTAGLLFSYGYSIVSSILRGLGDSKHPMIIIAGASIMNIILDYVFIISGMGTFGAALATILSQAVSFLAALFYMIKKRESLGFDFSFYYFRSREGSMPLLIKLGIPMMIQSCAITLSTLFVSANINVYGVTVSAVTGIGAKLGTVAGIVTIAMGQGCSVIVGQNFANQKFDRVKYSVLTTVTITSIFALILSICIIIWPEQIFSIFDSSPEVLALCHSYILIAVLNFWGSALRAPSTGLCNGMGFPILNFIMGLIDGIVMRIGLCYFLGTVLGIGLNGYWLGTAIAGFAFFFVMCPYFLSGKWKYHKPPIR